MKELYMDSKNKLYDNCSDCKNRLEERRWLIVSQKCKINKGILLHPKKCKYYEKVEYK